MVRLFGLKKGRPERGRSGGDDQKLHILYAANKTSFIGQQQTNNSVGHYIPPQGWGYGHSSYDWSVSGGYMVPPRVTVAGGAPVAYEPADSHSISQSHQPAASGTATTGQLAF